SPQELTLLQRAAEGGNVEAQWQLGLLYASGQGMPLDYVTAARWIQSAAEQGFTRAQSVLAWLFANGLGVDQDDAAAGRWYLAAAEQGVAKDQFMVATMYRFGRYGVEVDKERMLFWYQAAANQGHTPSQFALGKMLVQGKTIPADHETAFQWLSLADINGHKQAGEWLRQLMGTMPAESIEQAKQRMLNPQPELSAAPDMEGA
ncbi:MAG: tetratricopeptide repeat protein, partial [Gammaproteobacteria bacterium]